MWCDWLQLILLLDHHYLAHQKRSCRHVSAPLSVLYQCFREHQSHSVGLSRVSPAGVTTALARALLSTLSGLGAVHSTGTVMLGAMPRGAALRRGWAYSTRHHSHSHRRKHLLALTLYDKSPSSKSCEGEQVAMVVLITTPTMLAAS